VGNCISGQNERATHVQTHTTQEFDPPAVSAPQPSPVEPNVGPPARGDMAERPASLDSLPDGPRLAIAAFLQSRRDMHGQAQDLHGMVQDVSALRLINRSFQKTFLELPPGSAVLAKSRLLERLRQAIKVCLMGDQHGVRDAVNCNLAAPVLGLLAPAVRAECVRQAIGMFPPHDRGRAIAGLAPGLAHLQPSDRAALVEAAVAMRSESHSGTVVAVGGLLQQVDCLQPEQCDALIACASRSIEFEGDGVRQLVIASLGQAIRHLPARQREILVQWALNLPREFDRCKALAGLGSAMAAEPSMNAGGRIVEAALHIDNDDNRAYAIAGLAVGMGAMEPVLRSRFLTAAFGFTHEALKTQVAVALGAAAEHLSDTARADLVRTAAPAGATELSAEDTLFGRTCMTRRIRGLAAGMAHLSREQCNDLARAALRCQDLVESADRISALGQGLEHVGTELREQLVEAAIALGTQHPIFMVTAITGLGVGANHLNDNQRNRLVDNVVAITAHARFIGRLRALGALTTGAAAMDAA
jgi:hypothetical protein